MRFNAELLKTRRTINVDGYGAGWLFEIDRRRSPTRWTWHGYHDFLAANWEKTQRILKGQMGE